VVALKSGIRLDLVFSGKVQYDFVKNLHAQFRADDLASPEIHHDLCLVAFFNEAIDIPDLQLKSCSSICGLTFISLRSMSFSGYVSYGAGICICRNQGFCIPAGQPSVTLRQGQVPLLGNMKGFANCHYAKLATVAVNDPDLFSPDLLIHSDVFANVLLLMFSPPEVISSQRKDISSSIAKGPTFSPLRFLKPNKPCSISLSPINNAYGILFSVLS